MKLWGGKKKTGGSFEDSYETWGWNLSHFFNAWKIQNLSPPLCPQIHLAALFFPSCPPCYRANPCHCQDLNAAFSVYHIFGIQHHFHEPDIEGEREGRKGGKDIKWHTQRITSVHRHINMLTHMQEQRVSLCLISLAVYQGDREFSTAKFPVDKTVFGEVGPYECWTAQRRRRRKRKGWQGASI